MEYNSFQEDRNHTIVDFLKRPRSIDTITWLSTTAPFTLLNTYYIPDVTVASRSIACKCSDFRFWRWTTVFRFLINVNRFSIGRLVAVLEPYPTLTGGAANFQSLTALTQYPHIFIDAGTEPTGVFKVPYVGRRAAYDAKADLAIPWAAVRLYVFNQLNGSTGSTSANITVFVHCEDISLALPVYNDITPFAPSFEEAKLRRAFYKDKGKAHMNSEPELESKVGAIVNKTKKAVKTATTIANAGAGVLKDIGAAVAWVKETVPGLLAAAGFEKPRNFELTMPMIQQPARGLCSINNSDNSVPLAANYKNSLSINNQVFGCSSDEMDIAYICSKPCFIESITWSDSDAPGKVLQTWPVSPCFCASFSSSELAPTLMNYVASMFRYWRGDLNWKISFVMNQFYSGRLGLGVYFGNITTDIPTFLTYDQIDMIPKVYCDLKNSTDCTFTVPWSMHTPYLNCRMASRTGEPGISMINIDNLTSSQGTVVLWVVNPLVRPSTVPSSIPLNIFTYAGPNIEFEVPSFPSVVPVPVPLAPNVNLVPEQNNVIAHSNSTSENLNTTAQTGRGDHVLLVTKGLQTTTFAEASIGEKISNLRQLTRMFSLVADDAVAMNKSLTIDPAYFGFDIANVYNCPRYRIARIFAFWKGGVRYKLIPKRVSTDTYPVFYVTSLSSPGGVPFPPDNSGPNTSGNQIGFSWFINLNSSPILEVEVPFYAKDYLGVISTINAPARMDLRMWYEEFQSFEYSLYEAYGDDGTFGWLKAAPNLQQLP